MSTKKSSPRYFDTSNLSGLHTPFSLASILRDNGGARNMEADELHQLRTCRIGGRVNLGVGRGHVTFVRVPAPRKKAGRRRGRR